MARTKKTETKTKPKKEVIKLDFEETMKAFIKEVQEAKLPESAEAPDYDFKKALELAQITWKEITVAPNVALNFLKERVLVGTVGVRLRKILSDNCSIMELRTDTGIYSAKVICEEMQYKPSAKGTWGVNPLSFHKL